MKTILILGASSDIGMAYINRLEAAHKAGEAQIIAHYRTMSSKFEYLLTSAKNVPIKAMQADFCSQTSVEELIRQIREGYTSPTHILHLAAGQFHHMRLRQFDSRLAKEEMETQVFSLAEMLKAFLPDMAKKRYGKVVVILSTYTFGIPPKFVTDYIICKYALLGLVKAAAAEYCEKGICINGFSPSLMETKFLNGMDNRISEISAEKAPLKRNMHISEVLATIDLLLSDENSYMCGTNINLSGGER